MLLNLDIWNELETTELQTWTPRLICQNVNQNIIPRIVSKTECQKHLRLVSTNDLHVCFPKMKSDIMSNWNVENEIRNWFWKCCTTLISNKNLTINAKYDAPKKWIPRTSNTQQQHPRLKFVNEIRDSFLTMLSGNAFHYWRPNWFRNWYPIKIYKNTER